MRTPPYVLFQSATEEPRSKAFDARECVKICASPLNPSAHGRGVEYVVAVAWSAQAQTADAPSLATVLNQVADEAADLEDFVRRLEADPRFIVERHRAGLLALLSHIETLERQHKAVMASNGDPIAAAFDLLGRSPSYAASWSFHTPLQVVIGEQLFCRQTAKAWRDKGLTVDDGETRQLIARLAMHVTPQTRKAGHLSVMDVADVVGALQGAIAEESKKYVNGTPVPDWLMYARRLLEGLGYPPEGESVAS